MIKSDDKKRARINCMRYVLHQLPYPNKNHDVVQTPDPKLVGRPQDIYEKGERPISLRPHP